MHLTDVRTANHALALLKAVYNWGIKRELIKINPAIGVDKFKERSRERFVQPSEFPNLLDAINSHADKRMRDFFLLCLWTGARSGNVMAMRWDQLDLDAGIWCIPKTKNGDSQTIKLIDSALVTLKNEPKQISLILGSFRAGDFKHAKVIWLMLEEPGRLFLIKQALAIYGHMI